jgi:hypothetical protein
MSRSFYLVACLVLGLSNLCSAQEQPIAPSTPFKQSVIGYATVEEAYQALKAKSGVTFSITKPDPWVIATEPVTFTQWSFTPQGHYAHPAVVRREIKQKEGNVYVEMTALCQAEKIPCDKLIDEFKQMNERMVQTIQGNLGKGQQK